MKSCEGGNGLRLVVVMVSRCCGRDQGRRGDWTIHVLLYPTYSLRYICLSVHLPQFTRLPIPKEGQGKTRERGKNRQKGKGKWE